VLNYFRKLVQLRKKEPVLVYGRYRLLDKGNPDIYAYTRELNGKKILVLLNFRDKISVASTGIDLENARILANNYPDPPDGNKLRPYEALVYELQAK
jgi:oligo-1,6-glucosidase